MSRFIPIIFLFLLSHFYFHGHCQSNDPKIYYSFKNEDVELTLKRGKLKVHHFIQERKFYNVKSNPSMTEEYIFTRSFSEIKKIKAHVGKPKSNRPGKFIKYEVKFSNIDKESYFSNGVFYEDNYYYSIPFKEVEPGGYTHLEYQVDLSDPHFMQNFYFTDYYPVKKATYTITVDPEINIGWVLYGDQKDDVVYTKETLDKGETKHTWNLSNIEPYHEEPNSPGFSHSATHLIAYIKNYTTEEEQVSVLSDLDDLFNWYQSFLDRIPKVDSTDLLQLTKKIIAGSKDEREKAERIFYWVQDNIRYIAIEDGWRGFIPYPASEVCNKKYGDCKDMSNLLYTMLTFADIDARRAWVGTRKRPYEYEDLPDPTVDNHMVTIAFIEDSIYVLDATSAHTPFGVPSAFILSKQVFYKGVNDGYSIYRVPKYDPENCVIDNSINVKVIGNSLKGNASKTINFFEYAKFQYYYNQSISDHKSFFKDYLSLGNPKYQLENYSIDTLVDRAQLRINYEFEIPRYVKQLGSSKFVNLNLTKPLANTTIKNNRNQSYELEYKKMLKSEVALILNSTDSVLVVPEKVEEKFDVGSIKAEYKLKDNSLHYYREIQIDRLLIKPEEFDEWNSFVKGVKDVYSTAVEIKS
ncbi:MAG: DUF3857 domain-containing protein [Crocinitomicaceae bacterium]|nr:DUF3857 domain-containing protein [Crocinitomicaceae bacterium]